MPLPQTMVMEKMFCKCSGLACLLMVSATSMTFGQEWSQFRGGQLQVDAVNELVRWMNYPRRLEMLPGTTQEIGAIA